MANQQAWDDRQEFLRLFERLRSHLDIFKGVFKEIEKLKTDVLDDTQRKAEMKKLMAEDPHWKLPKIQAKYAEFKVIYDYLDN